MCSQKKIKVLVVDDSALMRKMIPLIISSDENIEVIGTAMDGDFALRKIPYLKPDVITLDINMPRMDGLTTLKSIVRDFRIPVILVSSLTEEGAEITLRGLEMGAFDFVSKPKESISIKISAISHELIDKIKLSTNYKPLKYKEPRQPFKKYFQQNTALPLKTYTAESIVAIGISTGGPKALTDILPMLPADFPSAILIVQHMPEGFTDILSRRLDSICKIRVKEASDGEILSPGTAFIAPGGRHLMIKRTNYGIITVLSNSPAVAGHEPSANVLFSSVAKEYRERSVGIIMTGMGNDGVEGIGRIREFGGITIAQDEETSVVYGMPKAAIERGFVDIVLSLDNIAINLLKIIGSRNFNKEQMKGEIRQEIFH